MTYNDVRVLSVVEALKLVETVEIRTVAFTKVSAIPARLILGVVTLHSGTLRARRVVHGLGVRRVVRCIHGRGDRAVVRALLETATTLLAGLLHHRRCQYDVNAIISHSSTLTTAFQ